MNAIYNAMLRKARTIEPWKAAFKSGKKYITIARKLPSSARIGSHSVSISRNAVKRKRLAINVFRRMRGLPEIHYLDDIKGRGPVYTVKNPRARIKLGTKEQSDRRKISERVWARQNPGTAFSTSKDITVPQPLTEGARFISNLRRPVRYASYAGFAGLGAFGAHKVRRHLQSRGRRVGKVSKSCGFINDSGLYQTYDDSGNVIELFPEDGIQLEKSGDLASAMAMSLCKMFGRGLANV